MASTTASNVNKPFVVLDEAFADSVASSKEMEPDALVRR
jgi:hypothetical protein